MANPKTRVPPIWPVVPKFFGAGMTHRGAVREHNDDSILTDPTGTLWAIADGMGGYRHGGMASDIVIDCLSSVPDDTLPGPALSTRLEKANQLIRNTSRDAAIGRMGATVVALMIQNSVAHLAWAGDCRAYLMRRGNLRLMTRDHTVVQDLVEQGLLRDHDRDGHPEAHIVTRAVGFEDSVDIDAEVVPLVVGDRVLLCSDGLTACLGDHQIANFVARAESPETLCFDLLSASLETGAPDNVSVICIFSREA